MALKNMYKGLLEKIKSKPIQKLVLKKQRLTVIKDVSSFKNDSQTMPEKLIIEIANPKRYFVFSGTSLTSLFNF